MYISNKMMSGMCPKCTHKAIPKHARIVWLYKKTRHLLLLSLVNVAKYKNVYLNSRQKGAKGFHYHGF